jgi:hypothetical protein
LSPKIEKKMRYVTIVNLLELPQADAQDQTLAVGAVQRWLSSQDWLFILDNADDLTMARAFIPTGRNGHVILTTWATAGLWKTIAFRQFWGYSNKGT